MGCSYDKHSRRRELGLTMVIEVRMDGCKQNREAEIGCLGLGD